jgi:small subunit ribosomal protein S16
MLIIRFARRGRKKQAFFDLVVAEKSRAVQKKFIEKLGYLNPHTDGGKGALVFDADRVVYYLKNGAQMSQSAARILTKEGLKEAGKFIEQRVNKPKKEVPAPEPKEEVVEEAPKEEVSETTEAPAKETAPVEEKKEEVKKESGDKPEVAEDAEKKDA